MLPYSTRFGVYNHSGSAVDHALYVVPAGRVAVVKQLIFVAYAAPATAAFVLAGVADLIEFVASANPQVFSLSTGLVFNAGETMQVSFDSHQWTAHAHGFLLTA